MSKQGKAEEVGIEEGNRMIAIFHGALHDSEREYMIYSNESLKDFSLKIKAINKRDDNLEYHSSWDWLMPVVEKIENSGGAFIIYRRKVFVLFDTENHNYTPEELDEKPEFSYQTSYFDGNKIDYVYECVIKFIKWFNQQPPNPIH